MVVVMAAAVLLPAATSHAHAVLLRSTPGDGAVLDASPPGVQLEFSEPVTAIGTGLTVVDATGRRVDVGRDGVGSDSPADVQGAVVSRALAEELPDGEYVVAWRVRSDDGHAVTGTATFRILRPDVTTEALSDGKGTSSAAPSSAAPTGRSSTLLDTARTAPAEVRAAPSDARGIRAAGIADAAVRAILTVAILLTAGLLTVGIKIGRAPAHRQTVQALGRHAAITGLTAAVASTLLQSVIQAGGLQANFLRDALLSPPILHPSAARVAGLTAVLLAGRARGAGIGPAGAGPGQGRTAVAAAGAVTALFAFALDGHQRGAGRTTLALVDAAHVAGAAAWIAAVATLAIVVHRRIGDADDARPLARRVARTSGISLALLSVAGGYQALALVGPPNTVLDSDYGRTLAVKVAIVGLAVLVALTARIRAGARFGARHAAASTDWSLARSSLRIELGLLAAAAAATGLLVTLPPPSNAPPPGSAVSAPLGDGLLLELAIDTTRPGRTDVHALVIEAGAITERPLVLWMRLEPLGAGQQQRPVETEPAPVGTGHWFAVLPALAPGLWQVTVAFQSEVEPDRTATVRLHLDGTSPP